MTPHSVTSETGRAASDDDAFRFPLSFAQQRLWFLDRLEPGSSAYNVPLILRLSGALDVAALERALTGLVERHEVLRTTFLEEEGEPFQVVHPPAPRTLEVSDLSKEADVDGVVLALATEEANRPFDLAAGPLFRMKLLRAREREHVLVLAIHHAVADAWSLGVLRRDLTELYRAEVELRSPALPELEVQYGDFAVWQREWFQGERLDLQLDYWKRTLSGAPSLLELPSDRPRPAVQSDRGGHARAVFPRELAERLEILSREEGTTMFMTLLAAFATLLARCGNQRDVVVGTPIANRQRLELEPLIGFFANTLALRLDLSGNPSFRELLARARSTVLEAHAHQDLPFEQLVAELNPGRSLSHSPLFQVLFQLQLPGGDGGFDFPGLAVSRVELDRGRAKFDLALTMHRGDAGLHASFEYSADLFEPETVQRMLEHLQTLLEAAAADPDQAITDLPLLTEAEREQRASWNATSVAYVDSDRCVQELVEAQVERTPNQTAIAFDGGTVTYAELNARANRLAWRLRELGVGPDVLVAISMQRSCELVVAALAVLKAGGAYSPLDPTYPHERLHFMLEETRAAVLLTQHALAPELSDNRAHVLCMDEEPQAVAACSSENPPLRATPDDLAYVLFTSGSTGWPKGVAMPHRPLVNLLLWQREHFSISPAARTLQFASLSFDVAFQEIFSTWASGGTLVLVDEETRRDAEALLGFMDAEVVERLFLPFAALQHLAETSLALDRAPAALREVITAGEALQASAAIRRLFGRLDGCVLHNHYGPTESHVVTAFSLDHDPAEWPSRPPIGKPIANAQIHLLDENAQPVPVGVAGELHIGGPVLARGYLNRPDLTAERFILDPIGAASERLYRTGDLARYLPDGTIEFLGRIDNQVKVRGYRVELGEIESALLRHDQLRDAVALVREDTLGDQRLIAYTVPHESPGPTAAMLRDFLARSLPDFMIPSAFVTLEALPLGPTGKVDRQGLPAPDRSQAIVETLVPPRNPTEQALVTIWQELLGIDEPIGIRDDFFALGGHSLLAVRLMAQIERKLGVKLPLATLFEGATIEWLAGRIAETGAADVRWPTLVPLRSSGGNPPLFLLHGRDGELLYYRDLVNNLGPDQPAYGVQPVGLDGEEQPFLSVQEMAAHYADELQGFQPEGPYLLAGLCFSGVLAYEVAHQLERRGHPPALLALIDAAPFGHKRVGRIDLERRKLRDFLAGDLRGKGTWIARRAKGLVYKLRTRVRFILYDAFSRTGRRLPRGLRDVEGAILRALQSYKTPTSSLRVTLFRAADNSERALDQRSDWRKLAGEVEIHPIVVKGIRHDNIVREPYAAALAAELERCIEKALASDLAPVASVHGDSA